MGIDLSVGIDCLEQQHQAARHRLQADSGFTARERSAFCQKWRDNVSEYYSHHRYPCGKPLCDLLMESIGSLLISGCEKS